MARIFMTGFEAGTLAVATRTVGSPAISATTPRTGSYCLDLVTSTNNAIFLLPGALAELYFRVGVKPISALWVRGNLIGFGSGLYNLLNICSDSLGGLHIVRGHALNGTVHATTAAALAVGGWNCLEGHVVLDPVAGSVTLKVDGVDVLSVSGVDTGSSSQYVRMGYSHDTSALSSPAGMDAHFDDLAINDTSGTVNNTWIGRGGIYPALVNGAGSHTEFTPSAGANWECVDEVPPDDDTSYVESGVLGERDLYTLAPITPTDGTISAVQWVAVAKLTEPGIGNVQRLVRHEGVDDVGDDRAVDTSYRLLTDIMELAPDLTAWSVAKVNALQIGQQVA